MVNTEDCGSSNIGSIPVLGARATYGVTVGESPSLRRGAEFMRAKMMNPSESREGETFPRLAKVRGSTLRIKVNS